MRLLCFVLILIGVSLASRAVLAEGELAERAAISALTQAALRTNDFQSLEDASRAYRNEKSRSSSGIWKLTLFYAGIGAAIKSAQGDAGFRELEAKMRKWAARYPRSPAAHIALSSVLIEHGWDFRGNGYASSVKPEAWAPFHRYIAMARENLEQFKSVASDDPRWYEVMLLVAKAEGWDQERFDNVLSEALRREPLFYQTYFAALEYLLPKWQRGSRPN